MEIYKIRGGDLEELKNKNYTIGVGISLGNKFFSVDNIIEYIRFSLKYTKDYVLVYVADSIHSINIQVRNRKTKEDATKKAIKLGKEILDLVKEKSEQVFSSDEKIKIKYFNWDNFINTSFKEKLSYLENKYKTDETFKKYILAIIDNFTKDEIRRFSTEDKIKLGEYIISELPELICRQSLDNFNLDAFLYPYDSMLSEFVDKIQKGILFPEIKEVILDRKPKVFIEVR